MLKDKNFILLIVIKFLFLLKTSIEMDNIPLILIKSELILKLNYIIFDSFKDITM